DELEDRDPRVGRAGGDPGGGRRRPGGDHAERQAVGRGRPGRDRAGGRRAGRRPQGPTDLPVRPPRVHGGEGAVRRDDAGRSGRGVGRGGAV
ncbi:MAG: hypothetical protein AVDCRST_MAG64-2874, partial [uncultured Phycisphaerae bacterium]